MNPAIPYIQKHHRRVLQGQMRPSVLSCSERQAPQLWALFAAACASLGLPSDGPHAAQLHVLASTEPRAYFLAVRCSPETAARADAAYQQLNAGDGSIAYVDCNASEDETEQDAIAAGMPSPHAYVPHIIVTGALAELLDAQHLRAAMVAALAPAVISPAGAHPNPRLCRCASV